MTESTLLDAGFGWGHLTLFVPVRYQYAWEWVVFVSIFALATLDTTPVLSEATSFIYALSS